MSKICLDAGHGGRDSGACGHGRREKDDVLRMTLRVAEMLRNAGQDVYLTRDHDIYESPITKATEANIAKADFFVSFHRNSAGNPTASGYETCVYGDSGKAKVFADYVNGKMAEIGFRNRGTKVRKDLCVLNSTKMQAVLVEVGFISNTEDNALFDSKFDDICMAIGEGVLMAAGVGLTSDKPILPGLQIAIPTPIPPSTKRELGHVDVTYQVYTDRWWSSVKNQEDWAGQGDNRPIRYIGVCVSKGKIKGRVYTRKNGWLPYLTFEDSYNINDLNKGVLGDGSDILAVELYYYTPDGFEYKEVNYRVSVKNNEEFYAKQIDNRKDSQMDGYAGDLKNYVDKLQIWVE